MELDLPPLPTTNSEPGSSSELTSPMPRQLMSVSIGGPGGRTAVAFSSDSVTSKDDEEDEDPFAGEVKKINVAQQNPPSPAAAPAPAAGQASASSKAHLHLPPHLPLHPIGSRMTDVSTATAAAGPLDPTLQAQMNIASLQAKLEEIQRAQRMVQLQSEQLQWQQHQYPPPYQTSQSSQPLQQLPLLHQQSAPMAQTLPRGPTPDDGLSSVDAAMQDDRLSPVGGVHLLAPPPPAQRSTSQQGYRSKATKDVGGASAGSRKRDRAGSYSQVDDEAAPRVLSSRPVSAAAAYRSDLDNRRLYEHRQAEFKRPPSGERDAATMEIAAKHIDQRTIEEDEHLQQLKRCRSASPRTAQRAATAAKQHQLQQQQQRNASASTLVSSSPAHSPPSTSPSAEPRKAHHRRRKTEELLPHETWLCPYVNAATGVGCGKLYRTSSSRSISKHVECCKHRPADMPSTTHLPPGQTNGMLGAEGLLSGGRNGGTALLAATALANKPGGRDGAIPSVSGKKRKQKARRKSFELAPHERWNCPFACGQFFRSTSTKSIHRHKLTCLRAPSADGSGDVGGAKMDDESTSRAHQQEQERRAIERLRQKQAITAQQRNSAGQIARREQEEYDRRMGRAPSLVQDEPIGPASRSRSSGRGGVASHSNSRSQSRAKRFSDESDDASSTDADEDTDGEEFDEDESASDEDGAMEAQDEVDALGEQRPSSRARPRGPPHVHPIKVEDPASAGAGGTLRHHGRRKSFTDIYSPVSLAAGAVGHDSMAMDLTIGLQTSPTFDAAIFEQDFSMAVAQQPTPIGHDQPHLQIAIGMSPAVGMLDSPLCLLADPQQANPASDPTDCVSPLSVLDQQALQLPQTSPSSVAPTSHMHDRMQQEVDLKAQLHQFNSQRDQLAKLDQLAKMQALSHKQQLERAQLELQQRDQLHRQVAHLGVPTSPILTPLPAADGDPMLKAQQQQVLLVHPSLDHASSLLLHAHTTDTAVGSASSSAGSSSGGDDNSPDPLAHHQRGHSAGSNNGSAFEAPPTSVGAQQQPPPSHQHQQSTTMRVPSQEELLSNQLQLAQLQQKLADLQRLKHEQHVQHSIAMAKVQAAAGGSTAAAAAAAAAAFEASLAPVAPSGGAIGGPADALSMVPSASSAGSGLAPASASSQEATALLRHLLEKQQQENHLMLQRSHALQHPHPHHHHPHRLSPPNASAMTDPPTILRYESDSSLIPPHELVRPDSSASMRELSQEMSAMNWPSHHAQHQHQQQHHHQTMHVQQQQPQPQSHQLMHQQPMYHTMQPTHAHHQQQQQQHHVPMSYLQSPQSLHTNPHAPMHMQMQVPMHSHHSPYSVQPTYADLNAHRLAPPPMMQQQQQQQQLSHQQQQPPPAASLSTSSSVVGGLSHPPPKKLMKSRRVGTQLPPNERWTCPLHCGKFYKKSSSNSIRRHAMECLTSLHAKSNPTTPVTPAELAQMVAGGVDRTAKKKPAKDAASSAAAGGEPADKTKRGGQAPKKEAGQSTGSTPPDLILPLASGPSLPLGSGALSPSDLLGLPQFDDADAEDDDAGGEEGSEMEEDQPHAEETDLAMLLDA